MLQITYISMARPELPASAIEDIVGVSRRNNSALGITGLLLYDGYHFLQAIEGDAPLVRKTYDRIKADPRHRAVVMLGARDIAERSFGGLPMARERVAIASGDTVAELIDCMTEELRDPAIRELFRSCARVRSAA